MVKLKRKVTLKNKSKLIANSGKESNSKKRLVIVIILALFLGGFFLFLKPNICEVKKHSDIIQNSDTTSSTDSSKVNCSTEDTIQTNEITERSHLSNNSKENCSKTDISSTKNVSEKTSVKNTSSNTIDEKVTKVIRGDYGNGKIRKKHLGIEYKTIQNKVNEMYKNGQIE